MLPDGALVWPNHLPNLVLMVLIPGFGVAILLLTLVLLSPRLPTQLCLRLRQEPPLLRCQNPPLLLIPPVVRMQNLAVSIVFMSLMAPAIPSLLRLGAIPAISLIILLPMIQLVPLIAALVLVKLPSANQLPFLVWATKLPLRAMFVLTLCPGKMAVLFAMTTPTQNALITPKYLLVLNVSNPAITLPLFVLPRETPLA